MVQKDHIMRIIEQFADFLWAIVFNKKTHNYGLALIKIEETYNGLLHLNPNEIKYAGVSEIINKNTNKDILHTDNIEIMATLLFQEADILEKIHGINMLSNIFYYKSFELFLHIYNYTGNSKYCKNIEEVIAKLEYYSLGNNIIFTMYEYFLKIEFYGKAEDKLYCLLDNDYPNIKEEIKNFYGQILEKDDIVLGRGNLPRNEIIEALKQLR